MTASYRFVVSGRVQGVGFRYFAAARARALGVAGWVRNRSDGCVEGLAAGEAGAVERFRTWLAQGPPAARVAGVDWSPSEDPVEDGGFDVRR